MKKRILFVAGSLRVGGIEKSLVNLLRSIDYKTYEIHLFLYSNSGEYINEVPKEVKLINKFTLLNCLGLTMQESKNTKNLALILLRSFFALACRLFGSVIVFKIVFSFLPKYKDFDVAISFSNNVNPNSLYFGFNQFVLTKVDAIKKIAWIHSDYVKAGLNNKINKSEYMNFDNIVNVSLAGKKTFDKVIPELKDKSMVVYNTFPIKKIREQALQNNPYEEWEKIKIVTVGRIDENKSINRIINASEKLIKDGFDFVWYIVGEGSLRSSLETRVKILGLGDIVIFVGNQANPYPFIKNADLFVLSSKYEGMPMVVTESLILKTPVVATRYKAAEEQIKDEFNGLIVENSEDGLYTALKRIFKEDYLLERLQNNLANTEISNESALKQFNDLINY